MNKQPIVILGGMGPEASAYLYDLLIKQSIELFGAKNNEDFPEIILHSIPVPDFISSDRREQEALEMLQHRVKMLNKLNPLCMAIACNTAHVLLDDLLQVSKSPFVSMVDETIRTIKQTEVNSIGLLGTPSTIRSNIYQDAFERVGIKTVTLKEDKLTMLEKIIRNVISGDTHKKDKSILRRLSDLLISGGAQAIVLGCTELPLVFPKDYRKKVFNSVEILSIALLKKYYSQNQKKNSRSLNQPLPL